ncbi:MULTISPECIES: Ig-like domain-containing protein [Ramlibacter]|uniref:Big-1 domain-containing protein n=1 Tax=Ramlibacter aquaticus TaxID=2780094 RepID=A0ABR9SCS6_9BURK|nr:MULTISPECIES: Ig-like domain-containing protein [Ramlibacter]MBE7940019.1 hypothetical protein [Ramlibacter aquaticus]
MIKMLRLFAGLALVATLAACGGGGGSAGTTAGSGGTTGTTGTGGTTTTANPTTQVTNFVMLLDKSTLLNAGTATAKLTVLAVNAQNNIVPGATVSVSTDANSIYTPGGTVTDANGLYTGTVGFGADKSDRTITITTTVNGLVKKITLQVSGSQLALVTNPSLPSTNQSGTFTARLTDASTQPIAGVTLTITSDIATLNGKTATTDSNGNISVNFTAPGTAGGSSITVAGNGISSTLGLQVGTTVASVALPTNATPSLSALPNVVAPNVSGSTSSQSQLKFLFLDSNNQPVQNVRVRFDITSTGLGSTDSSISSGTNTVYTTSAGVATANFIPGTTSSPNDGVHIRACYSGSDFASTTDCPQSVAVNLTVAQQALAISIGDDNLLQRGTGTYIKQFTITVADSAGRAVPNAPVSISVDIPYYGKGLYTQTPTFPLLIQPVGSNTSIPNATTAPSVYGNRISCINEDLNRNGFADPFENIDGSVDSSGQPTLQPRQSDILISYVDPNVTTTDANGLLLIKVEYSQQVATWLEYHVRASTSVSGSQGTAERAFITTFIKGDEVNGSFLTPPYGINSCSTPN